MDWGGCYRCQRCFAVCPAGAISIFERNPENSVKPQEAADGKSLEALLRMRRSCRHFKAEEIPKDEINRMLAVLENVPTGSNLQSLEFHVVYQKTKMDKFRGYFREKVMENVARGIYPGVFGPDDFENQIGLENTRNFGDLYFGGAPHMLIISSLKERGTWRIDPHLAAAWWDLICASNGYACLLVTLPVGAMNKMPDVKAMLGIPEERYFDMVLPFGIPETKFARGVQREGVIPKREITFPVLNPEGKCLDRQ